MIKGINLVIVFLLEVAMLVSYGLYGMTRQWSFLPKLLFTIFIISTAIVLWSIFAAPKSGYRLEMPYLAIFRAGMFLLSAWCLYESGYKNIALVLALLTAITQIVSLFTEK